MAKTLRIALIGDHQADVIAHQAIPRALSLVADANQIELEYEWIETINLDVELNSHLSGYQGIWCVPASPYANMQGALSAIRHARENQIAFLGTCGGYQHAILEYARNVLQLTQADNAEVNPDTDFPLISPLVCSLIEASGMITLLENSQIHGIYNELEVNEAYHCSYGFNREYLHLFEQTDLQVSGYDIDGDPRCVELKNHPFFIATAYQPERSALKDKVHPIINQFILSASRI